MGLGGRVAQGLAGAQVEAAVVLGALDHAVEHGALGQMGLAVGTQAVAEHELRARAAVVVSLDVFGV